MHPDITQRLEACGVIPVVVLDDASAAVPLVDALLAGGIDVVEFTFRTDAAPAAIAAIRSQRPDMLVGAGTILTAGQVSAAKAAGAVFAVAPGLNRTVLAAAADAGLFFMPGVSTPSEIEAAIESGCNELKFFPAEPMGGVKYLKSVAAPYAHLGLQYIPLGGITIDNVSAYLSETHVLACGGTWIAKRDAIAAGDFERIAKNAAEARTTVQAVRGD